MLNKGYQEANLIEDLKTFCKEHHVERFIYTYFEYVHDAKIDDCVPRLVIPKLLVENLELSTKIL